MSECGKCGQEHVAALGGPPCHGHISTGRKGQPRNPRAGQPCRAVAVKGMTVCQKHGAGSPQARAKSQRSITEQKARAALERKLGDAGDPITDPIGKLCAIAGRAVAFMESLAERVDEMDDADRDQARADIVVYGRAIKDAASVVESIIRMGIAERLTKADEAKTAGIVAFLDGVLSELGHNPRDPEVAGVVARKLELLAS